MPRAEIVLDEEALGMTRDSVLEKLKDGTPSIVLAAAGENGFYVNPQTLKPGEVEVTIRRIEEIVQQKSCWR